MNKILNPFEYLSTGKALGWGLAGTLFSICLLTAVSWPVEGDVSKIITILSSNLLLWLPLSLLLYVMALVLSPSRIRAVDIFATNLFAMLPTIVILGVLSLCAMWLGSIVCEPRSACEVLKHPDSVFCRNTALVAIEYLQSDRDRPVGFDGLVDGLGLFRLPRFGQYERMEEHRRFCDLLCLRECGQPIADRIHQIGRSAVRRYAEPRPGSVFLFAPIMNPQKKYGAANRNLQRHIWLGELIISHRYNHIPLLDSSPGGFCRSWSYKTHPAQK